MGKDEKKKKVSDEDEPYDPALEKYYDELERREMEEKETRESYEKYLEQEAENLMKEREIEEVVEQEYDVDIPEDSDVDVDIDFFKDVKTEEQVMQRIRLAIILSDRDKKYRMLKEIRDELDGIYRDGMKPSTLSEQFTNVGAQRYFADVEDFYFNDWREEFVINGVIPKNGLTVMAGQSGGGKSWLAYEMMVSLLLRKKFLDRFEVQNCNVLYFDLENDASTSRKRLLKLTRYIGGDEMEHLIKHGRMLNVLYWDVRESSAAMQILEKEIQGIRKSIDEKSSRQELVVFVDVLKRLIKFDENDANETNDVISRLKQMCQKYKVSIVLIHHTKKTNDYEQKFDLFSSMRGSSEIYNIADSVLGIVSVGKTRESEDVLDRYTIKELTFFQTKLRRALDFGQLDVEMVEGIDKKTETLCEIKFRVVDKKQITEVENKVVEYLRKKGGFVKKGDIDKELENKCSPKQIRTALEGLIDRSEVVYEGAKSARKYKLLESKDTEQTELGGKKWKW